MKTRLKHLSKSTISIILAVLMVVSTLAVGIVATNAAFIDSDSTVGDDPTAGSFKVMCGANNWVSSDTTYSLNQTISSGKYYVEMNNPGYFCLSNSSNSQYRPSTNGAASGTGDYSTGTNAWNANATTTASRVRICIDTNQTDKWKPHVWVEAVNYYVHLAQGDNNYNDWPAAGDLIGSQGADYQVSANTIYCFGINTSSSNKDNLIDLPATANIVKAGDTSEIEFVQSSTNYGGGTGGKFRTTSSGTMNILYDGTTLTATFTSDNPPTPSEPEFYVYGVGFSTSSNAWNWLGDKTKLKKMTAGTTAGQYYLEHTVAANDEFAIYGVDNGTETHYRVEGDSNFALATDGTKQAYAKGWGKKTFLLSNFSVGDEIKIWIDINSGAECVWAEYAAIPFDGYYLAGRFATATAEANITANTTGQPVGEHADEYGIEKTAGNRYWSWDENSTNIKFTQDGNTHHYTLNTYRTIAQLSENKNNTGHDPFYFIIHDQTEKLVSSNSVGNSFQNYPGGSDSTKLTLSPLTGALLDSKEVRFSNQVTQSDGRVVIHLDDTNYNTSTHTGSIKIWYTIDNETPAAGEGLNITATPNPLAQGKERTISAEIINMDTSKFQANTLVYTFTVKDSSGNTVETITRKDQNTDVVTVTDTRTEAGTYTYEVTVGGKKAGTAEDLRVLKASTTAVYSELGVYVTTHDLANYVDGDDAGWVQINNQTAPYDVLRGSLSEHQSFTLAISNEAGFVLGYEPYDYTNPENRYYDIKTSYITATPVGAKDAETITTYVVTARAGCTITAINVDYQNKTIRAVGSYTKTDNTSTYSDTTQKVRYYFAEQADEMAVSDPSTAPANNVGMRIAYWNNSLAEPHSGVVTADVVDGVDKDGHIGTAYASEWSTKTDSNNIWVNTSKAEINASDNAFNSTVRFKIYSVELPVWATSFRFIKKDASNYDIGAEPVNMTDKSDAWAHCIALNPNRVYLLYNYKVSGNERYFVKGIVLDKSLWTSGRTASETRTINYPGTEKFKSNVVNYKDITALQNSETGINSALQTFYKTTQSSFPHPLYFGYMTDDTGTEKWGANYKLWDNLANNNSTGGKKSFYATVWGLTGITNSSIDTSANMRALTNKNGYGLLLSSDSNYVHPLFDFRQTGVNGATQNGFLYSGVDTPNTNVASTVKEGVDFEFYKSEFNGITTYSYDSLCDYNRKFNTNTGTWYGATTTDGKKYAYGTDSDDAHYYGLFPFGGNDDKYTSTGFGLEFDIDFYMTNSGYLTNAQNKKEDIVFNFSGDDDVWIYVDGVRVLDLGGAHKISAGSINFSKGIAYYKTPAKDTKDLTSNADSYSYNSSYMKEVDFVSLMEAYGVKFDKKDGTTKHKFQMFYMERGAFQSNMSISFNLPQATGLNINNKVLATNVNEGLKLDALSSSNSDFFEYTIQDKTATGDEYTAVKALGLGTPWTYVSTEAGTDYTSPDYPVYTGMSRLFNGVEYILTAASGSSTEAQTPFTEGSSFAPLADVVYKVHEPYLKNPEADDTTVTKKTTMNGDFYLLGNQGAQFDSKVPANTMVEVKQKVTLGEVKENGSNPITHASVANNKTGNYYTTSYTIVDDSNNKVIGSSNDAIITNDVLAADGRTSSNGFYYSNYSQKADDKRPRMTVTFTNEIATGNIRIEKRIDDNTTPDKIFYFKVEFGQVFGDTDNAALKEKKTLKYHVYSIANNQSVYEDDLTYGEKGIRLYPGQYALITGVPVETRYKVTENGTGGYSVSSIDKKAYKGGYAIGNRGAITGTEVPTPTSSDSTYTDEYNTKFAEYATTSFYTEHLEGKSYSATSDRSVTVSEGSTADDDYTYYTNMIPTISETVVGTDYVSLSDVKFVNTKESITVTFKYYDREVVNGTPAHIALTPSHYSVKLSNLDEYTKYQDAEHTIFDYVDYKELIEKAAISFFANGGTSVGNVVDEYKMWSTQAAAVAAMKNEINLNTGSKYGEANVKFHTSSTGKVNPNTGHPYITADGATPAYDPQFVHGEKWVSYLDEDGEDMDELSVYNGDYFDPELRDTHKNSKGDYDFKGPGSISKYENIKEIVVWMYSVPRKYNIKVYGYQSGGNDTLPVAKTFTRPGDTNQSTVYVATATNVNRQSTAYFNQRLGGALPGTQYDTNAAGYLAQYGVDNAGTFTPSVNGYNNFKPNECTAASYTDNNTTYKFAYWSFDPDGKEIASSEMGYWYRVTGDVNLYAVYTTEDQPLRTGLTISKNGSDSYFDTNGDSWTRLNAMVTPYGCAVADPKIYQMTNVNIYLSAQIRENPETYTVEYVKTLFDMYRDQLKTIVEQNAGVNEFSKQYNYTGTVDLTLTTKGYVFTVSGTPVASQLSNPNLVILSNKNRLQFTTTYKTSALDKNTKGAVCIMQAAAMNYGGDWIVSDNCLVYQYAKYTPSTP